MKWRFEYKIGDRVDYETGSSRREWRLLIEDAAATELLSLVEAKGVVPETEEPLWKKVCWIFRATNDRLLLLPYEPFTPCRFVVDMLGPNFVDRVLATPEEKKVWSSSDGWTWLHVPGDDAR